MRVRAKSVIVISGLCALVQAQEPAKAPFDRVRFAAQSRPGEAHQRLAAMVGA